MLALPRQLAIYVLTRLNPEVWIRIQTGQRLRVRLGSAVGRTIWWRHVYEPDTHELLRRFLRPGDVFVDIGANVGYFSLVASQLVGPTGEVHSFEPDPRAFALLARSAAGARNIWCHRVAAWSDQARLDLSDGADPAFTFVSASKQPGASIRAIAVPMDRYLGAILGARPIRMVKIDVEGAEIEVLHGMQEFLGRDRPILVIEASAVNLARFRRRVEDLFGVLASHGYRARTPRGDYLVDAAALANIAGDIGPNLLFEPS